MKIGLSALFSESTMDTAATYAQTFLGITYTSLLSKTLTSHRTRLKLFEKALKRQRNSS